MELKEKVWYLKKNFPREFAQTREKVFGMMSDAQPLLCTCGHIATGFHELHCGKFNRAVDRKTCALLKGLIRPARGCVK